LSDRPNGSVPVATLYAVIGQLSVENQVLKAQLQAIMNPAPAIKAESKPEAAN
jgi:hypothetical protein